MSTNGAAPFGSLPTCDDVMPSVIRIKQPSLETLKEDVVQPPLRSTTADKPTSALAAAVQPGSVAASPAAITHCPNTAADGQLFDFLMRASQRKHCVPAQGLHSAAGGDEDGRGHSAPPQAMMTMTYPVRDWNAKDIRVCVWNGLSFTPADLTALPEPFFYWGVFCFPLWITRRLWAVAEQVQYTTANTDCTDANPESETPLLVMDSKIARAVLFPDPSHITLCTSFGDAVNLNSFGSHSTLDSANADDHLQYSARRPNVLEQHIWPLLLSGYDIGYTVCSSAHNAQPGHTYDINLSRLYIPLVALHSCYIKPQIIPVPTCLILYSCEQHVVRVCTALKEYFAAVPRCADRNAVYPKVRGSVQRMSDNQRAVRRSMTNRYLNSPVRYVDTLMMHVTHCEDAKDPAKLKKDVTTGVSLLVLDGTVCRYKECCGRVDGGTTALSVADTTARLAAQFERLATLCKPWCQKIAFVEIGMSAKQADVRKSIAVAANASRTQRFFDVALTVPS